MRWDTAGLAVALAFAAALVFAACGHNEDQHAAGGANANPVGPGAPCAEEAVGPFSSWANVQDEQGAVGDGVADDTDALQAALDRVGADGASPVAYLPAGTYRITRTLTLTERIAVSLVGDDPETTRIVWDGGATGPMLVADGVTMSRFARITWDGAGQATMGVAHWWNHDRGNYAPTNLNHADEVFVDLGKGIVGGRLDAGYGWNDAEVSIERCRFDRCTEAGVSVESWNALDYWIWDSAFDSCARGVTNEFGAGNFMVYRSRFEASSIADVTLQNTQFFSLRGNVSVGSRRFLQAGNMYQNAAPMAVQGNRVLDTTDPVAIDVGNTGPLMLIDNQIRSAAGAIGPVVAMTGSGTGPDLVSIGNRYTVEDPLSVNQPDGRSWALEDQVVDRADIDDAIPEFVGFAPRVAHAVFEVPPGADAAAIQTAIETAAASDDPRPVVHLPAGDYSIGQPLVIPANRSLQLVGDGHFTALHWHGDDAGPMVSLPGPSLATLRDLSLHGSNLATAIHVSQADQPGGRVFGSGLDSQVPSVANVLADGLAHTQVELRSHNLSSGTGVSARAVSGARIFILGCATTAAAESAGLFEVASGGQLFVGDCWYEGSGSRLFQGDSGRFTWQGGNLAPADPNHGGGPEDASIYLDDFRGYATLLGLNLNLAAASNGVLIGSEQAETRALLLGLQGNQPGYFVRTASGGSVSLSSSKLYVADQGSMAIPDVGTRDEGLVLGALEQTRSAIVSYPSARPEGATDVRLYRLQTVNVSVGLEVTRD